MANLITLAQYDALSAQREQGFVSEVDSYLHLMFERDPKGQKRMNRARQNLDNLVAYKSILLLPYSRAEVRRKLEEEISYYKLDHGNTNVFTAIQTVLKNTVSKNISDLVSASYEHIFRQKKLLDCPTIQNKLSDQAALVSDSNSALQRLGQRLDLWSRSEFSRYRLLQKSLEEISRRALSTTPELSLLSNASRMTEDQPRFKKALCGLRKQGYISKNSSEKILELLLNTPQPPQEIKFFQVPAEPNKKVTASAPAKPKTEVGDSPERLEYLTQHLNLPPDKAQELVPQLALNDILGTHDKLIQYVGEQLSQELIKANPQLLLYRKEELLSDYLQTIKKMQARIIQHPELESKYGLVNNLSTYSRIEKLLELKDKLEKETAPSKEEKAPADSFDLEQYKDNLLERANLIPEVVRAITTGKNGGFIGEKYAPKEYFRKNANKRVNPGLMDQNYGDIFDQMEKMGALVCKTNKNNPLYRHNAHLEDITDPFLREYYRVTFYAKQIIAQEGKITPKIEVNLKIS